MISDLSEQREREISSLMNKHEQQIAELINKHELELRAGQEMLVRRRSDDSPSVVATSSTDSVYLQTKPPTFWV